MTVPSFTTLEYAQQILKNEVKTPIDEQPWKDHRLPTKLPKDHRAVASTSDEPINEHWEIWGPEIL